MPDNPRKRPPQDLIDRMCEAVARLGNRSAAALELDIPRNTLIRYTRHISGSPKGGGFNPIHAAKHPERDRVARPGREPIAVEVPGSVAPPVATTPEPTPLRWTEKGDEATATFTADREIRTADDAMDYANIDRDVWFVREIEIGSWTTNMKLRRGQDADKRWLPDAGFTKLGWKISLKLGRILPKPFQAAHAALFERIKAHSPHYPAIRRAASKNPSLLVADLFDVHFGKLAWARESSQDYDLKIAETIFADAVDDILDQAVGREIEQVLIPVGNDFFHVDGVTNATTGGTVVDTDGRYGKIIEIGEMSMVRAIERARSVGRVVVKHVPGNHDRTSSLHLCRFLHAWFRNCGDVDVDFEPLPRKYVAYGLHLIGLTHSNEEKPTSLPLIMATEAPSLWAASEFREYQCGHFHSPKQMISRPISSHEGVRVRWLHSLSAIDSWHYRKGLVGGKRAAEAFLYDSVTGNVNGIEVSLRRAS